MALLSEELNHWTAVVVQLITAQAPHMSHWLLAALVMGVGYVGYRLLEAVLFRLVSLAVLLAAAWIAYHVVLLH